MTQSLELTAVQARVLGVLIEKERTVPDTYPLTINSLVAGCNQKSSREPVMELTESDVIHALDELKAQSLVIDHLSGRVARYSHQLGKILQIPSQSVAVLAILMLRGPQTAGELRNNCERLHRFADISAIEAFLQELAERASAPLAKLLARQPGSREPRWAHLLAGEPELPVASPNVVSADQASLLTRIETLEAQLAELKAEFSALKAQLGD